MFPGSKVVTEGVEIWKRASIAPLNSLGVLAVPGRTRLRQGTFLFNIPWSFQPRVNRV